MSNHNKDKLKDESSNGSGGPEEKVGIYICRCGGNISDHVDVEQLAENVKDLPGVSRVHINSFMCSDPGQELIQNDINNGDVDRVVVASCAPSLHETTFRGAIKRAGMNQYLYEHANIREQVSWVHNGEAATKKAAELVTAAHEKAKHLEALDPIIVDARKHVTVIGGGIAGMRASIDLATQGFEVSIIEKSAFVGGQAAKLNTLYPDLSSAENLIRDLYTAIKESEKIKIYTCCKVSGFKGFIGNFELTITESDCPDSENGSGNLSGKFIAGSGIFVDSSKEKTGEMDIKTGAVIMATGFNTYTPFKGEFGYDEVENVTTLQQFIQDIEKEKNSGKKSAYLYLNDRKIKRIAFIHCVGSRQIPGIHEPHGDGHLNEYCSRTCCSAILKMAVEIRERFPGTHVFDFYRDIRTYGRFQEDLYDDASKNQVMFFRFEPEAGPVVSQMEGKEFPVNIKVKDVLTFNEEIEVDVDMVVLATGMIPNNIDDMVAMMKLPVGADRFLQEVHPKLRPVEVANTGILLAGTCQAPMDITESCAAAQAAAVKTTALLGKGFIELDPFVARVNPDLCRGSGECAKACPVENAIEMDKTAKVNPALCTGCGICTAVCPENAIDVNGWTLKQYEKMVDAILAD